MSSNAQYYPFLVVLPSPGKPGLLVYPFQQSAFNCYKTLHTGLKIYHIFSTKLAKIIMSTPLSDTFYETINIYMYLSRYQNWLIWCSFDTLNCLNGCFCVICFNVHICYDIISVKEEIKSIIIIVSICWQNGVIHFVIKMFNRWIFACCTLWIFQIRELVSLKFIVWYLKI